MNARQAKENQPRRDMIIEVSEPWFSLLQSGVKTVEGRKGGPKWSGLCPKDSLTFRARDGRLLPVKIVGVRRYESLEAFLMKELAAALPGVSSEEEGVKVYRQWWSQEEIMLQGVLALEVDVHAHCDGPFEKIWQLPNSAV